MVFTKLKKDWSSEMDLMDEQYFTRYVSNMSFGGISLIATRPDFISTSFIGQSWNSLTVMLHVFILVVQIHLYVLHVHTWNNICGNKEFTSFQKHHIHYKVSFSFISQSTCFFNRMLTIDQSTDKHLALPTQLLTKWHLAHYLYLFS